MSSNHILSEKSWEEINPILSGNHILKLVSRNMDSCGLFFGVFCCCRLFVCLFGFIVIVGLFLVSYVADGELLENTLNIETLVTTLQELATKFK